MHTILGANGVIARELSRCLAQRHAPIRQVSRQPRAVNATDALVSADLLDAAAVQAAVAGSTVAYLVAGLPYARKIWEAQWPVVMRNVIDACARHGTRLVFFDNVYAYGRVDGPMTEDTPYNPCSRKGEVRARIATMLMDEVQRGTVHAMIVRAADFYGPGATQSLPHTAVRERLRAGKTAQWLGDPAVVHTFTYTPDAARTMALLADDPAAYGQVWHALTHDMPITGSEFVRMACTLAGRPYGVQAMGPLGVRALSLIVPTLREFPEMMYQYTADYRFSSEKASRALLAHATPYRDGIAAMLAD